MMAYLLNCSFFNTPHFNIPIMLIKMELLPDAKLKMHKIQAYRKLFWVIG